MTSAAAVGQVAARVVAAADVDHLAGRVHRRGPVLPRPVRPGGERGPGAVAAGVEQVGHGVGARHEDAPVRGDVHARVERQPDEVDGRRPALAVGDLRVGVHLDRAVRRRAARDHQHPAVGERGGGGVPASAVHGGQRRPGVGAVVVGARVVDAVAVGEVAARDEQPPVGEVGVPRAEQVDRGAVGAPRLRGRDAGPRDRVPDVRGAGVLVHGARRVVAAAPEQHLPVGQEGGVDRDVRQAEHRAPNGRRCPVPPGGQHQREAVDEPPDEPDDGGDPRPQDVHGLILAHRRMRTG